MKEGRRNESPGLPTAYEVRLQPTHAVAHDLHGEIRFETRDPGKEQRNGPLVDQLHQVEPNEQSDDQGRQPREAGHPVEESPVGFAFFSAVTIVISCFGS